METTHTWSEVWCQVDAPTGLEGGQGTVTKVKSRSDGKLGALKTLHPEHLKSTERRYRMQQEANALEALKGRGVPYLLDSNVPQWNTKDIPLWIVMEWVNGQTVAEACAKGPLDLDCSLAAVSQMLSTIDRCHRLQIYHRDLKPNNVIFHDDDLSAPVLVDFGNAWAQADSQHKHSFETPIGAEMGNRFLRLPENAPGEVSRDPRSDLTMAIGMLFFMLSGKAPRQLNDPEGKMPHESAINQFPDELTSDHRWPRLRRVFNIGFQLRIDHRFQSVSDLTERLSNLSPSPDADVSDEIEVELASISDVLSSAAARDVEAHQPMMRTGSERFQAKLGQCLSGNGFGCGGSGPNFTQGGKADHINFFMQKSQTSHLIHYQHLISADRGIVIAMVNLENGDWDRYYEGPASDPEGLWEAVEAKAPKVAVKLLQAMKRKLASQFE